MFLLWTSRFIPSDLYQAPSLQLAPKQAKEFYGRHGRFPENGAKNSQTSAPTLMIHFTAGQRELEFKCTPATNKFN